MGLSPAATVAQRGPAPWPATVLLLLAVPPLLAPVLVPALMLVLMLALALPSAPAAANPALARDKRCLNCHAVDRKLVGPAFKDVARRYAGQPEAAAKLADKIVKGGAGAWGPVSMPPNPQLTPTEAKLLAQWVLAAR